MAMRAAGTAKIIRSRMWSGTTPNRGAHLEHKYTASSSPQAMMMPYQYTGRPKISKATRFKVNSSPRPGNDTTCTMVNPPPSAG